MEVTVASCRDEDDVADALERYRPDVLLVQFAPVGRQALASAHGLGGSVRYGVGLDNIDLVAATERGIAVARIPDYCLDEVADHTLALVLAVERGIVALARDVEAGGWSFRAAGTVRRLRGRTFGLLGFGQIARRVALSRSRVRVCVVAHDPALSADEILADGAEPRSLEALLGDADVLSIHAPLTDSTRGLLDARALELLTRGRSSSIRHVAASSTRTRSSTLWRAVGSEELRWTSSRTSLPRQTTRFVACPGSC